MYDRYLSYSAFFIPAAILINTLQLSILCGSMLWTDRYNGMLEQILSFSSRAEYFLSRVLSIVIISSSTAVILGLISITIIKDEVSLSYTTTPFLFLYAVVMSSMIFASLSFCVSAVVRTPDKLTMFNRMITMPMIAISGIFYPPEYLPSIISNIAKFNPLTYAASLIRASLLGTQTNILHIILLAFFAGTMLAIAYTLFKEMDITY